MSKIESYAPGAFCWAELATGDAAAAKQFYSEMFGWTPVDVPMPEGTYTLLQAHGENAAALYPAPPGVPVHWGVYFSVTTADEAAARIKAAGGKIVKGPFDVMDAGRMAVAQDPQGAYFSVWQAGKQIGATHGGPLGQVAWPELGTPDPAAAVAFYTSVLGWNTKPETGVESAQYVEWTLGGKSIGGLMPMKGEEWAGIPPHWMVYVTVADCDERAAKAQQLGGKLRVPPMDIPNVGRFSIIDDPQGATFSILHLTAMHTPATA